MTEYKPWAVKPLSDRVLLHKCENPDPEGLVLPEKTKDATNFCTVLAVGPKCKEAWPIGGVVRVIEDVGQDLNEVPGGDGEFWLAREGMLDRAVYL